MKNLDLEMGQVGVHELQEDELLEIYGGDIFLESSGIFYWVEMWGGVNMVNAMFPKDTLMA